MICLALGLGALGFFALRKACHCRHSCDGHGWHHDGWNPMWRRRGLHYLFRRIDASPAQERAIVAELDQLRETVRRARANAYTARADVAAAIRSAELDDAAVANLQNRIDSAFGDVRTAALKALRNVHGLLDPGQRERIADLLDASWWRRNGHAGGPYRV